MKKQRFHDCTNRSEIEGSVTFEKRLLRVGRNTDNFAKDNLKSSKLYDSRMAGHRPNITWKPIPITFEN